MIVGNSLLFSSQKRSPASPNPTGLNIIRATCSMTTNAKVAASAQTREILFANPSTVPQAWSEEVIYMILFYCPWNSGTLILKGLKMNLLQKSANKAVKWVVKIMYVAYNGWQIIANWKNIKVLKSFTKRPKCLMNELKRLQGCLNY